MSTLVELFIPVITTAIILISTFAIAFSLFVFMKKYITKIAGKTRTKIDDYAINIVKGPISIFIILFGAITAIRY